MEFELQVLGSGVFRTLPYHRASSPSTGPTGHRRQSEFHQAGSGPLFLQLKKPAERGSDLLYFRSALLPYFLGTLFGSYEALEFIERDSKVHGQIYWQSRQLFGSFLYKYWNAHVSPKS